MSYVQTNSDLSPRLPGWKRNVGGVVRGDCSWWFPGGLLFLVLTISGCSFPWEGDDVEMNRAESSPEGREVSTSDPGHIRMLDLLRQYAALVAVDHPILGDALARSRREKLTNAQKLYSGSKEELLHLALLRKNLGESELWTGDLDGGIKTLEIVSNRLSELDEKYGLLPEPIVEVAYLLGVAYMRRGESENCCARNAPENCLLPIRGGGIHKHQNNSKKAIVRFTEVLQKGVAGSPRHLKAKWLLNIMYMTIGGYPKQVPGKYLIPSSVFESEETFPRFENISSRVGVDAFDLLGGVVIDDFTGDGYLDIVTSTWDPSGQMHLFRNNQNGTFSDETEQSNLVGSVGGFNMTQADYDNDGDMDILLLRGAWMRKHGLIPNSLLQNDGSGKFVDVTFSAGLGEEHYPTQTAAWADYDNDGDLDLYIGNEFLEKMVHAPCQLFRNNGNGTFSDVAKEAGVQNFGYTKGVSWGDYDADRFPDLYVSNFEGGNRLFRNNRDGTFNDVTQELGVAEPTMSFPTWFWDFDNDGILDLFVSGYDWNRGNLAAVVASRLGLPDNHDRAHLYRGTLQGGFEEVANAQNLQQQLTLPMGANFGDLDNDGFLDFYLGTGYPDYEALMPSVMYRNRGGSGFSDVTTAGGFGHLQKGHGVSFADLDNDGDQDVYEQMGGFYPGDKSFNSLFENPGFGNHWIAITLVGVRSNRSAIGARIHIQVVEEGVARSIYRHVNSGGSFGANPLRQTIGLGGSLMIEQLDVEWPTTGLRQTFRDLSVDQFIEITEGEDSYRTLLLATFKMGPS